MTEENKKIETACMLKGTQAPAAVQGASILMHRKFQPAGQAL